MLDFIQFETDLQECLHRLRSPGYAPADAVCQVMGCPPGEGAGQVHVLLIQAIKQMDPGEALQADSQPRRVYEFLHMRFVLGLTQEEIADRLHMSVRNVQRIQPEAVHVLALRLWGDFHNRTAHEAPPAGLDLAQDWQEQVDKELTSLESHRPDAHSEIEQVLAELLDTNGPLAKIFKGEVEPGFVQPGIVADVHPSVLRQVLLSILVRISRVVLGGKVEIFSGLEDGRVKISINGQVAEGSAFDNLDFASGIPIPAGIAIDVTRTDERFFIQVWLPSSAQNLVLVIEDNLDVVHYYRRCTAGTNFKIVHASSADAVAEVLENTPPDIIVIDVMMPDIDGWQMLTHLHEDHKTRSIPIIVCSIVQEPELAYALGALICLTKPVNHRQFVGALEQCLHHSRAASS